MIVRPLGARDADDYQALRLEALQESPAAFSASHHDEVGRSFAEIAARVTPAADGSLCVFGAFDAGQLAGFVAFVRPQREKLRHCAELAGLYVAPARRRGGIGRALVDAVVVHAKSLDGVCRLKLGVNADNAAAMCLYRSAGFERYGVEPEALCVDGAFHDESLHSLRLDRST